MSHPGERDEALELWLRQARPVDITTSVCLDPETAASWVAGTLTGAALEQAQVHLADCDRCQTMIGALVRADFGGPPPVPVTRWSGWLGWAAPLGITATAAIAATVWVMLPTSQPEPVKEIAAVQAPAPAEESRNDIAPPSSAAVRETSQEPAAAAKAAPTGATAGGTVAPPLARQEQALEQRRDADRAAPATAAGPAGVQTYGAVAAPASPALADAAAANAARSQSRASAESITTVVEFASPDQSVRWRVGGPVVQRSTDRGARWESIGTGVAGNFTGGSAPAASICWLVGRGGIVLLTTDGRAWRRVPFPEPTDLASVVAGDARTAQITTADGRVFRTSDGGGLWSR